MVTNNDRAGWAQAAVDAFASKTEMDRAGEDFETIAADLLCDLMHLCDKNGVKFHEVLERGNANYQAEVELPRMSPGA